MFSKYFFFLVVKTMVLLVKSKKTIYRSIQDVIKTLVQSCFHRSSKGRKKNINFKALKGVFTFHAPLTVCRLGLKMCFYFRLTSVHFSLYNQTSILKVLHGNTKSPTGCMYTWRYNILYLTILYNIRNVSVFVCIAFKNAGD